MSQTTLTSKGQITIPKDIRQLLSLKTGDKVDFVVSESGEAIMKPVSKMAKEVFGLLSSPKRKALTVKDIDRRLKASFRDKII